MKSLLLFFVVFSLFLSSFNKNNYSIENDKSSQSIKNPTTTETSRLIKTSNAYVLKLTANNKDKNIVKELAEHSLSDISFKALIEYGLGVSANLATHFSGYLFSFITSAPNVGPTTIYDLKIMDKKEKTSIKAKTNRAIIICLNFTTGQYYTWSRGINLKIEKFRGSIKDALKYQSEITRGIRRDGLTFDLYGDISLLNEQEVTSTIDWGNYKIFLKEFLTFESEGVYRISVQNKGDKGNQNCFIWVENK